MAGSLNHIVNDDGTFVMQHIENLGDAREALEECHQIIAALVKDTPDRLSDICSAMSFPQAIVPILQEELWGPEENRIGSL